MSFTARLDAFTHDISFKRGKVQLVTGSDEVRQRIKVALWHHFNEYFLNRPRGVPWNDEILGSKMPETTLINIIRSQIERVPGVIQVLSIQITKAVRAYSISVSCVVQGSANESVSSINLNGVYIE